MDAERQAGGNEYSFKALWEKAKNKQVKPTFSVTLFISGIINIVMLVLGILNKGDCPVQKMIPMYLIIAGAIGLVSKILPFVNYKLESTFLKYLINMIFIFEFIWMIIGSVWVYSVYKPSFISAGPKYCNKVAYLFSFWIITIGYICIGVVILLTGCAMCVFSYKKRGQ